MPDVNGLRYPLGNVQPNIPSDMQNLASDINRRFLRVTPNVATLSAISDMVEGDQVYLTSHGITVKYSGALNGWVNHLNNWVIPTLQNGWTVFGSTTYDTVAFLLKDQVVYVRGSVSGGTVGPIFSLPSGYQPDKQKIIVTPSTNGGLARVDIGTGFATSNYYHGGSNGFISLNTTYPAEK